MNAVLKSALAAAGLALATQAVAQVTFYEHDGFQGRSFTTAQRVNTMQRAGFNDLASSAVVTGQRWQVCEDLSLKGRCTVLRPGQYPSLAAMGLNDRVSSMRPLQANARVNDRDYAPMPVVAQDYRRRRDERLYEADVTGTRAVVGTAAQRCWLEREQVVQRNDNINLPAAALGAVIGGILGHQVGGGSGKQIATVGGAVGGAALGSQYGRNAAQPLTQDVRHCDGNPAQATPSYWDVTYQFRGQEHHIQMSNPPGRTVTVNRNGEPRA